MRSESVEYQVRYLYSTCDIIQRSNVELCGVTKMQVTPSNFTVAEYCQQMAENKIIINREYQRSGKVWPPAARSYLIKTILLGYPIPKL